jgi:hypothetical protein
MGSPVIVADTGGPEQPKRATAGAAKEKAMANHERFVERVTRPKSLQGALKSRALHVY